MLRIQACGRQPANISFLDSDDYLEPDAYEYMIRRLRETGADVIRCGFRNVYRTYSEDDIEGIPSAEYGAEDFLALFTRDWRCGLMTDKLYRRTLFDDIWFLEGNKIDDEFFTYRGIIRAGKIISEPKVVFNYRHRKSGVMSSPDSRVALTRDKLAFSTIRRRDVITAYPTLKKLYDNHYADFLQLLLDEPYLTQDLEKEIKRHLMLFLREKPAPVISWKRWGQLMLLQKKNIKYRILGISIPRLMLSWRTISIEPDN